MTYTYKITLEYDGTRYQGFRSKKKNCIEKKFAEALTAATGQTPGIYAAVSTDPGVHAKRQILSLQLENIPDPDTLRSRLNQLLPADIAIRSISPASDRFRADYALLSATYTCTIDTTSAGLPFGIPYQLHLPGPLDLPAMEIAAEELTDSHDFAAFTDGRSKKSTVRDLRAITFSISESGILTIRFTAGSFLRHMPQRLAGTLLEIGTGTRKAGEIKQIFSGEKMASPACPSKAVCLTEVLCK